MNKKPKKHAFEEPERLEFVGLTEDLVPDVEDDIDVERVRAAEPESDSPGDNAVLAEEELKQGRDSEQWPHPK
jgi:hypothetical protein